jgi:hypothetical protein
MASQRIERGRFQTDGPKRLRRTRRELPEGGYSQWAHCITHFKRERLAAIERQERKEVEDR